MNDVDEILSELEPLARWVSRMPDLQVHAGLPGSGYSFNHRTRTISMDGATLFSETRDYNRGLVFHELAHAVLTRLHRHATSSYCQSQDIRMALNAVEDARIEDFLVARFPGARAWISEYNGKLLRNSVPEMRDMLRRSGQLPPLQELCASLLAKWWHGENIEVPARCLPYIEEVWPFFERVVRAYPDALPGEEADDRYNRSGVKMLYFADDLVEAPTTWEKAVRLAQGEAWDLIEEGIMPVFRKLSPPGSSRRTPPNQFPMLVQWLDRPWAEMPSNSAPRIARRFQIGPRGRSRKGAAMPWAESLATYKRLAQEQDRAIEGLVETIQQAFPPERERKWVGPRQTGTRIRLGAVFQAEADPRRVTDIWERKSPPTRPKPHFCVVIDRSGSMAQEDRMRSAAAGAVLLAEASCRADLPFSLFVFADRCIQLLAPGTDIDEAKGSIGGLVNAASGGTNTADALEQVAKHLEESPALHRMVVVLGDGEDNPRSVRPVVQQLERSGAIVVALGVGPSTGGMKACFKRARTGLSAKAIPAALAASLRASLRLAI